jgi:hypothetical protein
LGAQRPTTSHFGRFNPFYELARAGPLYGREDVTRPARSFAPAGIDMMP